MNPSAKRKAVIAQIESVFAGVRLEDGVGLKQGQGLDDHEDEAVCEKYREEDEKDDWRRIPIEKLDKCHSSLSFFDAKGMRFHLPAYIVAHLQGKAKTDPVYHLTSLTGYSLKQLSLLSDDQKRTIEAYLWELTDDPDFAFEGDKIATALEEYWSKK